MLQLQIPSEQQNKQAVQLTDGRTTIGSRAGNDIQLDDDSISAYHAEIVQGVNGEFYVTDCYSSHGTFLNGEQVKGKMRIVEGDELRFGDQVCVLNTTDADSDSGLGMGELLMQKAPASKMKAKADTATNKSAHAMPPSLDIKDKDLNQLSNELESNREAEVKPAQPEADAALTLENKRLIAALESTEAEKADMVFELAEMRRNLDEARRDLAKAEKAETTVNQSDANTSKKADVEKQIEDLQNELVDLWSSKSSITQETAKLAAEKEKLDKETTAVREELAEAKKNVAKLKKTESELKTSIGSFKKGSISRKNSYTNEWDNLPISEETERRMCGEIVNRMDLIDDLLASQNPKLLLAPGIKQHILEIRESFVDLLLDHSVQIFEVNPGNRLNTDDRNKVQLIDIEALEDGKLKRKALKQVAEQETDQSATVLETLRPGYVYENGEVTRVLKKANVVVI